MRGWGHHPAPVGAHPVLDTVADTAWQGAELVKRLFGRSAGGTTRSDRLPYALPNMA
jgi:hypothetical protein